MYRCVCIAALALLVSVIIAKDAVAQGNAGIVTRSADVTTISSPIEIDGSLNEAVWALRAEDWGAHPAPARHGQRSQ